jgi:CcmD family protein
MKTLKTMGPVIVAVLLLSGLVSAQQPAPKPAPASAQDGFVPVDSPIAPGDAIPAPRLVAIAYGFIWVVLFGYLWSVRSRLARVEREIEVVSRRVASDGK